MKKYRINKMVNIPFFLGGDFVHGNYAPDTGFYIELNDKGQTWVRHEKDSKQDMLSILTGETLDIWNGQGIISRL